MGGGSVATSGMQTYVLSRSQPPGERHGAIFTDESPAVIVERIRKKRGKDIWLMGGGELAREFLRADLVDELYLGVVPVLIGEGISLFSSGVSGRKVKLFEVKGSSE